MRRILLTGAVAAAMALQIQAGYNVYFPGSADNIIGSVNAISPNGRFAVIGDDENQVSYLWDAQDPTNYKKITSKGFRKITAFDVNDQGDVVGDVYVGQDKHQPGLYRNNEWQLLDLPDGCLNTNFAYRISNDGKIIGGICNIVDMNVETHGGFRPTRWIQNAEGEYDCYPVLGLPQSVNHHQGFWMQDMSEDGDVFVGYIMCGWSQCEIPVFVKGDEYCLFNEVVTKMEPWAPAIMGGLYEGFEADGTKIWLEDPTDPRVSLYPEYYIDGYHDNNTTRNFQGAFIYFDEKNQKIYGHRTVAENVTPEGDADLMHSVCVYDMNDGEFTDDFDNDLSMYTYAYKNAVFATVNQAVKQNEEDKAGVVIENGVTKSIEEYFGVETGMVITGIQCSDKHGKVFGGLYQIPNPATGAYNYCPIIFADSEFISHGAGVDDIVTDNDNVTIMVLDGKIVAAGAEKATVYTLSGAKVAEGNNLEVAPGFYVVKAGNKSSKIQVR